MEEFAKNFRDRRELGAACAAYQHGENVVDLWGGCRDESSGASWEQDTLVTVASMTKGLSATALAVANSRGWLDYDERVAHYWPQFGQQGKDSITVRQLLDHQAGLCVIDPPITLWMASNQDALAAVLARQRPAWKPGSRHGYHAISLGWYEGELLRRVDPQHRSLGRFFQEEVATPLGLEFYIGLPKTIPDSRIATIKVSGITDIVRGVRAMPWALTLGFLNPWSMTSKAFRFPRAPGNSPAARRAFLGVEGPAYNGIGQVRSIARSYGCLATGGTELGLSASTIEELTAAAVPPAMGDRDQVLRIDSSFSLGFKKPSVKLAFGTSQRAFGAPGLGGSFSYADPDLGLGFAYAPNRWNFQLLDDPRQRALRNAVSRCAVAANKAHALVNASVEAPPRCTAASE